MAIPVPVQQFLRLILIGLVLLPTTLPAAQPVTKRIEALAEQYFPDAQSVSEFSGTPPAASVYAGKQLLGYLLITDDVVHIPGYSGAPIYTLVGFSLEGEIRGVEILHHQEPILEAGVTEADLQRYLDQYPGKPIERRIRIGRTVRPDDIAIDGLTGATITAMVINEAITTSIRKVAESRGLLKGSDPVESVGPTPHPAADLWREIWDDRQVEIVVLGIGLAVLLGVLIFQDWLVRKPNMLRWLRDGYLLFTLIFIGWYTHAQLSVLNVFTFIQAVLRDFRWETFLVDPLIFILWGFVGVTLLLWGRGIYCGWLCPFGALQELIYKIGRKLGITWGWEPPQLVQQRLEAIKYIVFLGLFAVSLQSIGNIGSLVEIEPFKTAITLRFQREWGYIAYAVALLVTALFIPKFFCRYLCPLGAALAIPARLRIFDWLQRRKECGRPCQICANECESRAIRVTGEINANECHYCLECQVTHWSEERCPPLVDKRLARERSQLMRGNPPPSDKSA